jgi:hypothetical protein
MLPIRAQGMHTLIHRGGCRPARHPPSGSLRAADESARLSSKTQILKDVEMHIRNKSRQRRPNSICLKNMNIGKHKNVTPAKPYLKVDIGGGGRTKQTNKQTNKQTKILIP